MQDSCIHFKLPVHCDVNKLFIVVIAIILFPYKSSAVAEMGDRLATIDMGRKVGAAVPLSVGELGPHLIQCHLGRGLPPYQVNT